MLKIIIATMAIVFTAQATAGDYDCRGGVRGKGGLIMEGDSTGKIMKRLGKPDRYITLENKYGGAVGERWEWYKTGHNPKTIAITISGSEAVRVCEKIG